jgi:hypothetical protein
MILLQPKPWSFGQAKHGTFHYPPVQKDRFGREQDSFKALWNMVQKYDDQMCKAWKEDCIDTLLVFVCFIRRTSVDHS